MNEYLMEPEIVPYHTSPPVGEKALVLSPHPDDETLGCGGTIRLLVESGKEVKIIFLTSGGKSDPSLNEADAPHQDSIIDDYTALREKESEEAISILGVGDYEFLRFPDREIRAYYNEAFERLLKIMQDYMPDTVYSPSMVELNPDHRATSALALKLLDVFDIRVAFYEVTSPLRPNILVDTTYVHKCKETAVKKYSSQLRLIDYLRHIDALNVIRTLTVQGPRYIEAFWLVNRPLSDEEIKEWLSYKLPINFR